MNNNNNLSERQVECCIAYCQTTFSTPNGEVVNTYPCEQRVFSTANMWAIQKRRKQFGFNSSILVGII